jgi:hypothetical protein
MSRSKRITGIAMLGLLLLAAGVLFWPFLLTEVIRPVAQVAWLFLRLFVLSIDQRFYWMVLILGVVVLIVRLASRAQTEAPPLELMDLNETTFAIERWQNRFNPLEVSKRQDRALNRELADLLASSYASRQHALTKYEVMEALRDGRMALPGQMHAFLFPPEQVRRRRTVKELLQSLRTAPLKWFRRWSGQETAQKYHMIAEIISFMEASTEISHDQ